MIGRAIKTLTKYFALFLYLRQQRKTYRLSKILPDEKNIDPGTIVYGKLC